MLRNEIVPRVLLRSTTDLIEEVFDVPRTHFELLWHRAGMSGVAQDAQGSHLVCFRKDLRVCKGKAKNVPTVSWIEGVAQHCHAHDKRPHEFRLSAAVAQRPYRIGVHDELNDYDEYTDAKDLPSITTTFLTCARDAPSPPSGAKFWNRVMVMLAVGRSPRLASPYDAGDEVHAPELVRLVFDLVEHVLAQPSRLYAPGLAINENVAYLVVLDHETCRVATISDCWQTGFGELAAVLSVLLDLDVYAAGFPSFLRYKCLPSSGITAVSLLTSVFDSSAGRTVQFEEEEPIALLSGPAGKRGSVFSRSTAVFHLTRPSLQWESGGPGDSLGSSFVFKMKFVSPSTAKVELDMLEQITQALDGGTLPPTVAKHLALLELAASLSQYQSQVEDARIPPPPPAPEDFFQLVWPPPRGLFRRTLELLVLRNPTPLPAPLVDTALPDEAPTLSLSIRHSVQVFDQLLAVLATLAEHQCYHRDISVGHILHYQGHLVLVDWSAGIVARLSASESVSVGAEEAGFLRGSPDSAPLDWLNWNGSRLNWNTDPELRPPPRFKLGHVLESTIYCFLNVLAYRIAPQEDIWRFLRHQHQPDEVEHPTDYWHLRGVIWKCGPSEVFFRFEKRDELLAAIRSEDAELGELVDDVTNEWPLWVTDDDGTKALWAAVQAKLYYLSLL
ncbi:BZ3500_MvSof-1268-A1-R1_Chr2-1g04682 [Microbotryum saponariae]|uniref:BZ3500_MvSof-1268-A1-R1_Chr2-1g04682 protein n=1 Tax=Microbotryum saponariae TaxID=289078 RepID=A0A2X0KDR1_9BASI|nr:BZ3500_MvSof-1268-A1-R1_Chr2-1g04682 [Microbotryum saponariae]SCZ92309.1 BZ3501_MvSof-1269-A2-R1_Chr2-1g04338 [Microbotryum saponariae]